MDYQFYLLYGKHESEKRFRAMDYNRGVAVANLIHASMFTKEDKETLEKSEFFTINPDWTFEFRPIL